MQWSSVFIYTAALLVGCGGAAGNSLGRNGDGIDGHEVKEYVQDDKPLEPIVAIEPYSNSTRALQQGSSCKSNERTMIFKLRTDHYGYETSLTWSSVTGVFARAPRGNYNFADDTMYAFKYCVKIGHQYRLTIKDKGNDGLCCNYGKGTYSIRVDDEVIFDAKQQKTFTSVKTHTFRVKARPSKSQAGGNVIPSSAGKSDSGGPGCITVKVKADNNPEELSWQILNRNGGLVAKSPALKALVPVSKKVCLPKGQYQFVMKDKFGDGACCHDGQGEFKVYVGNKEIIRGGQFQREKRYKIQVNPNYHSNMSARDRDWLVSHNNRRKKYHAEFGKSYVPLEWSPQLAADSKRWATKLLDDCHVSGIKHEPGVDHGENLAKNKGSGSFGRLYPTDNILTRWVEHERYVGYPLNAHLTQCLWRATKYVGCGEAAKSMTKNGKSGTCRVQVCRYARAGNCNMGQHRASVGSNWIKPMMEEYSRCGPNCAPEGCW